MITAQKVFIRAAEHSMTSALDATSCPPQRSDLKFIENSGIFLCMLLKFVSLASKYPKILV